MSVVNQFEKPFNRNPDAAASVDDGQDPLSTGSFDGAQLRDTYEAEAMNSVQGDPGGHLPEPPAADFDADLISLPLLGSATAASPMCRKNTEAPHPGK